MQHDMGHLNSVYITLYAIYEAVIQKLFCIFGVLSTINNIHTEMVLLDAELTPVKLE